MRHHFFVQDELTLLLQRLIQVLNVDHLTNESLLYFLKDQISKALFVLRNTVLGREHLV